MQSTSCALWQVSQKGRVLIAVTAKLYSSLAGFAFYAPLEDRVDISTVEAGCHKVRPF
jgi:hypothetical protein